MATKGELVRKRSRQINRVELDEIPRKNRIWAAVEKFCKNGLMRVGLDARPSHPERELWYCPTATIWDAHRAAELFSEYGIRRVYDLGAGDLRFSLWLDRRGYDVVAYELNEDLATAVADHFRLGNVELRTRDYYEDYDDCIAPDAAVVAFGGTNKLPHPPSEGLAIQGYGETGITVWYGGEVVTWW